MYNQSFPNAFPRPMTFPTSAQLNAASRNSNTSANGPHHQNPVIRPASSNASLQNPSSAASNTHARPNALPPPPLNTSRPLVNFGGGRVSLHPTIPSVQLTQLTRPTVQPPPRLLAPEIPSPSRQLQASRSVPLQNVRPQALQAQKAPSQLKRKRLSDDEEEEEDEEEDDQDDEDDSDDEEEEDDSIVVSDNEEVPMADDVPDDEDDESAKKLAEILKQEAKEFIKTPLETSCVGGRSLRNRANIKKPDQSHIELIREAYELDEKKELIKELNIWKNTLSSQAAKASVVWPILKASMPLEAVRKEHDIVRRKLGLDSTDDEESDEEEDNEEDEDVSASMEEEEDDDDSSSSTEEDESEDEK